MQNSQEISIRPNLDFCKEQTIYKITQVLRDWPTSHIEFLLLSIEEIKIPTGQV